MSSSLQHVRCFRSGPSAACCDLLCYSEAVRISLIFGVLFSLVFLLFFGAMNTLIKEVSSGLHFYSFHPV